ncbi:MAG: hypothetical protein ACYDG4_06785 [Desulfuromonadaceae bacterium]
MSDENESTCALCGQTVSEEERDICLANTGRFNGLVFCSEHQRRFSACPAMRWQPGGRGLLR